MNSPDLHAIAERYHHALDAKPSKGPMTKKGIAAITDSVADVPDLLAEVTRLDQAVADLQAYAAGLQIGADSLRAQNQRLLQLTYASDDGTEYEHDHAPGEGEPECPACWAADIRAVLGIEP